MSDSDSPKGTPIPLNRKYGPKKSPPSKSSPSSRSKSMGSVDIEMFPRRCTRAFINRTKKASFQALARKLGIDTWYINDDDEKVFLFKGELCDAILLRTLAQNKKPTKKAKPTSPARKNPRSRGPVKAAHKS